MDLRNLKYAVYLPHTVFWLTVIAVTLLLSTLEYRKEH